MWVDSVEKVRDNPEHSSIIPLPWTRNSEDNELKRVKMYLNNIIDFQNSAFTTLSDIRREKLKKIKEKYEN